MAATDDLPRRILLVRPSALGDVARTVPALVTLRRAFPQADIDWLVRDTFTDAVAAHPDLSAVVPFPRRRFRRVGRSWPVTRELLRYIRDLRNRRYDRVYDLQGLIRSGLLTLVTHAPRRVGFADARELGWIGYNRRYRIGPHVVHTVDRMLALLEADGLTPVRDMRLHTAEADRRWAGEQLDRLELAPDRFALLAPTAMWRSKQWPIERFAMLADRLGELGLDGSVIVGAPEDVKPTRPLFDVADRPVDPPRHDLVGRTTVGQLMALIEQAGLVICNDSAALHLAVGLGRRCVGIFGPTDPEAVGPYGYPVGVVHARRDPDVHYRDQPDDQSLIARITVEDVWQAVQRVLESPPPATLHEPRPVCADRVEANP